MLSCLHMGKQVSFHSENSSFSANTREKTGGLTGLIISLSGGMIKDRRGANIVLIVVIIILVGIISFTLLRDNVRSESGASPNQLIIVDENET